MPNRAQLLMLVDWKGFLSNQSPHCLYVLCPSRVGVRMDAGDYARAVFPLGPGLVGLCVTLSSAATASSATPVAPLTFDNAVLDPRYEPAGDVAVKLALQVRVARIGADFFFFLYIGFIP